MAGVPMSRFCDMGESPNKSSLVSGHGFSRAKIDLDEGRPLLPQAGVEPQAK